MAFAEDLLEIRLVANGSLVHAACIPGLKLLCGRRVSVFGNVIHIHIVFALCVTIGFENITGPI